MIDYSGNWKSEIVQVNGVYKRIVVTDKEWIVASFADDSEAARFAQFLIAAPDLLAALSEIVRLSLVIKTAVAFSDAHIKEPDARRWDEVASALRQACAAIAQAEQPP